MSKKLLLIVNPTAGKRKATDYLPQIVGKLEKADFQIETRYTEIDKNATAITLEYGKGNDYIVCVGGDGTLKETICGVMELKLDCKIGYIPTGTTNDFAHSFNIPTDASKAVDTVIDGKELKVDIGDFNGIDRFVYVSCFGNFCDVSYKAEQSLKNKIGRGAYYWETVKELHKIKGFKATVECDDGEIFEGKFFYGGVSNSYSVAGFPALEDAGVEFDDGYNELTLIRMFENPQQFMSVAKTVLLTHDILENEHIIVKKGKNFKFYFDSEVDWTLDGEKGGKHKFVEINTIENAVTILVGC